VLSADNTLREQPRCFLVTFCHRTKSYPLQGSGSPCFCNHKTSKEIKAL
jgi:hypothetical protein